MAFRLKCVTFILVGAITASVWANPPEQVDGLRAIAEEQRELQQELDSMEGLTPRQRNVIRKNQQQIFTLAEGKQSLDDLTIEQKLKLDNALERINAELVNTTASRKGRDQCWRERKTGSKLQVTRCGTQGERDEAREGARAWMEKPKVCVPPGCGT